MTVWIGLDRGDTNVERLEHELLAALAALALRPSYVCTHPVRAAVAAPHWAASLELPGPADEPAGRRRELAAGLAAAFAAGAQDQASGLAYRDPHLPGAHPSAADVGAPALALLGPPGGVDLLLGGDAGRVHAWTAAAGLRARSEGRAVRFPGQYALPAQLSARELRARTPIAELLAVGTVAGPDVVVRTYGHLRPQFVDGLLALTVVPDGDGTVRPFELPVPPQCCETPQAYQARLALYQQTHAPQRGAPAAGPEKVTSGLLA